MQQAITLLDAQSRNPVPAQLIGGISPEIIALWSTTWAPVFEKVRQQFKDNGIAKEKWPEDAHWDWGNKLALTKGRLAYESYCIMAGDSLEGLMLLNNTKFSRLPNQRGQEVVYIEFLATAPWNRQELCNPRRFAGVGTILAEIAIQLSLDYEFGGRIGLHALPRAADFYRNVLHMTELGPDPDPQHQNLIYFEMTSQQASRFLSL